MTDKQRMERGARKMQEEAASQGIEAAPQSWKNKETDSVLRISRMSQPRLYNPSAIAPGETEFGFPTSTTVR